MKLIKKVSVVIAGTFLLLFAVLIIHIAVMVKTHRSRAEATIQMSRVDFKKPVDSASASMIQNRIKSIHGVKDTYFNQKDHILIYTFDNRLINSQKIYDEAIKNDGFASSRHLVSEADLSKGCPAMNPNSFYGKMTAMVSKLID